MSTLSIANNDDTVSPPERRPIVLLGGKIEENLDEIEQALMEQRVAVFQRNGGLVLPGSWARLGVIQDAIRIASSTSERTIFPPLFGGRMRQACHPPLWKSGDRLVAARRRACSRLIVPDSGVVVKAGALNQQGMSNKNKITK